MDADGWDARYRDTDLVWSAGPNRFVEAICAGLPVGRAIDLAAGEGRNAVWLAEQGWTVTAIDFSAVAIDKARRIADRRGVEIATETADLTTYRPAVRAHDLVLIAYLQLEETELAPILRSAAESVAPGGTFLLVNHDRQNLDRGHGGPQQAEVLTTPDGVTTFLDGLVVDRAEVVERPVEIEGGTAVALDTLVVARRPS